MSSGRRTAFAGAALVLATGSVAVMVLTVGEPRPVDVRRVDLSPVQPGVLSATYTTTVEARRSPTPVEVIAPPAPRPAPPDLQVTAAGTPPPPSSQPPPEHPAHDDHRPHDHPHDHRPHDHRPPHHPDPPFPHLPFPPFPPDCGRPHPANADCRPGHSPHDARRPCAPCAPR